MAGLRKKRFGFRFFCYGAPVNLILLEPTEIDAAGRAILTDRRAEHVRQVLNAPPGTTIRAGQVDGPLGRAVVEDIDESRVVLHCDFHEPIPPRPRVDVLLALPRPKVLRRLWAQLSAVGVGRIILTNACKVERNYFDAHVLQPDTYRPLLVEGLQQSRDTRLPLVTIHRQFKVLVEDELDALFPEGARLVADPGAPHRVTELIVTDPDIRALLAVGPEGGWTDFERDLLRTHGFRSVTMGSRILRADTACVAALSLVHEVLDTAARP